MVVQVPKVEIHDESARIVKGWGTVDIFDKANERLPIEEFKRIMPIIMKRGGLIMNRHTNQPVGKIINFEFRMRDTEEGPREGVYLTTEVYKDYDSDDEVWKEIKEGRMRGFSFGGRNTLEDVDFSKGISQKVLRGLEGHEFSYVPDGMNQVSTIEEINYIAKESISSFPLYDVLNDMDGTIILNSQGDYQRIHNFYDEQLCQILKGNDCISIKKNDNELSSLQSYGKSANHQIFLMGEISKENNLNNSLSKTFSFLKEGVRTHHCTICKSILNVCKDDGKNLGEFLIARYLNIVKNKNDDYALHRKDIEKSSFDNLGTSQIFSQQSQTGLFDFFSSYKDIHKEYLSIVQKVNSDDKALSKDVYTLNTEDKKGESFIKNNNVNNNMVDKVKSTETQKVEEAPQAADSVEPTEPVNPMDEMKDLLTRILDAVTVNKVDEDEDKKPEEEEDVEKEGDGEKVKLPESEGDEVSQNPPAEGAETDEAGANFLEKEGLEKIKSDIKKEVLKDLVDKRADTPRPVAKSNDNIQKSEGRKVPKTWAEANRMVKERGGH